MSIPRTSGGIGNVYLGNKVIALGGCTGNCDVRGARYIYQNFDFSQKESSAQGMALKPDGKKIYLVGEGSKAVQQYSLSNERLIQSYSFEKTKSISDSGSVPNSIFFKPDGTIMYILQYSNRTVRQYNLSTAWDIGNATLDTQKYASIELECTGLWFGRSGKYMYTLSRANSKIYRHTLTTAWDTSTMQASDQNFALASSGGYYHNLWFNDTGTQMFTTRRTDKKIEFYKLTDPRDLTTLVKISDLNVSSIEGDPMNLGFGDDFRYMYMSGYGNKKVYQFKTIGLCDQSQYSPGNNTIGYYTLDNDISNNAITTQYSKFPNGNIGGLSYSNSNTHYGKSYSLYCDQSNYAYLPASSLYEFGTSDFTVSVRFYSLTNSCIHCGFISNYYGDGSSSGDLKQGWRLSDRFNNGNSLNFCWDAGQTGSSDIYIDRNPGPSIYNNGWHNIILTRINGVFRLYLDTVLKDTYSGYTSNRIGRNAKIWLGGNSDINGCYSKGYMNDLIFENIGRDQTKINEYFHLTS